jgi:glycosyltransferase involved in cell wall biosynthesis
MKLLMVTHHLPRPSWGAGARNLALLRALAQRHDVALLALVDADNPTASDARHLESFVSAVRLVPLPPARNKRLRQASALLTGRSYLLVTHTRPEAQAALDDELAHARYDAVLFESVIVAGYRLPPGVRRIIDQHNIEFEVLLRAYQQDRAPLRRAYDWLEYRQLKPRELARCRAADLVLVTSARERALLERWAPGCRVRVVHNGVDLPPATPGDAATQEVPNRLVFTGTFTYYPNTQAVEYFAERCWHAIRRQVPSATWEIVGRDPPPEVVRLGALPGVRVTGTVPSVAPHLAAAAVAVVPLLAGGGTRLKILDALVAGKAVVSTSLGCEGLDVEPGRHLLVADDPAAFADAVVALLGDPARRAALGAAGRALVEERYQWDDSGAALLGALDELIAGERVRGRRFVPSY